MPTKTDQVYQELAKRRLVSFDEIVEVSRQVIGRLVSRKYVYRKYIYRLLRAGRIRRIRRGLYFIPSEDRRGRRPNRLAVASKVRPDGFLGYLAALEFYGANYPLSVYLVRTSVAREDYFDPFENEGIRFEATIVKDTKSEIIRSPLGTTGYSVRVSSRERTFLDCLERPGLVGSWESVFKSLSRLRGVDLGRLLSLLQERDEQTLVRKTGLILELLTVESPMFPMEQVRPYLRRLVSMVDGPSRYIARPDTAVFARGSMRVSPWDLYVPRNFEVQLRGATALSSPVLGT